MAIEDEILKEITDFFVQSRDFNGISMRWIMRAFNIDRSDLDAHINHLITANKITLAFESSSINPHIKRLPDLPVDAQLSKLAQENVNGICIYPTADVLASRSELLQYDDRPYTCRLALAEAQLVPVFFELHILEKYFRDPRYHCRFGDRDGSISVKDKHYLLGRMAKRDEIFLQSFGIGYDKDRNRVVMVFLRYLSDLSTEHQQIWKAHEVDQQCKVNSDYFRASILGDWPEYYSVYEAFIQEQVEINKLASLLGKPAFFRNTFEEQKRPIEFSPMLRPTLRNLQEFAHTLDKMLSDNIDRDFFRGDISLEDEIMLDQGGVEKRRLNTITLLERWLSAKYRTRDGEDVSREVVSSFREVRKARQPAAHAINQDEYDLSFPKEQDDLLGRVKQALTKLRLILSSHPKAKDYEVPKWLDGDKIVFF